MLINKCQTIRNLETIKESTSASLIKNDFLKIRKQNHGDGAHAPKLKLGLPFLTKHRCLHLTCFLPDSIFLSHNRVYYTCEIDQCHAAESKLPCRSDITRASTTAAVLWASISVVNGRGIEAFKLSKSRHSAAFQT